MGERWHLETKKKTGMRTDERSKKVKSTSIMIAGPCCRPPIWPGQPNGVRQRQTLASLPPGGCTAVRGPAAGRHAAAPARGGTAARPPAERQAPGPRHGAVKKPSKRLPWGWETCLWERTFCASGEAQNAVFCSEEPGHCLSSYVDGLGFVAH